MSDIDELAALAKAVAPGPWRGATWYESEGDGWCGVGPLRSDDDGNEPGGDAESAADRDAAFIAACSPDVILDLIRRVREAERERDSAHRMMEEAARRLDVDTDGLKPVHVFRALDAVRAERDALASRVREAEALAVKLADGLALVMHERDEALADLATMTRVYERACDSQVEAQRERDEARAERDAAIAAMEAGRKRLSRLFPRCRDCADRARPDDPCLMDGVGCTDDTERAAREIERLRAALREHARKAGT